MSDKREKKMIKVATNLPEKRDTPPRRNYDTTYYIKENK